MIIIHPKKCEAGKSSESNMPSESIINNTIIGEATWIDTCEDVHTMDHDIRAKMRIPSSSCSSLLTKHDIKDHHHDHDQTSNIKHQTSNIKHQTPSSSLHSSWPQHLSGGWEWSYSYTRHSRHSRHTRHSGHWRNTSCHGAARRANVTSVAPKWMLSFLGIEASQENISPPCFRTIDEPNLR